MSVINKKKLKNWAIQRKQNLLTTIWNCFVFLYSQAGYPRADLITVIFTHFKHQTRRTQNTHIDVFFTRDKRMTTTELFVFGTKTVNDQK